DVGDDGAAAWLVGGVDVVEDDGHAHGRDLVAHRVRGGLRRPHVEVDADDAVAVTGQGAAGGGAEAAARAQDERPALARFGTVGGARYLLRGVRPGGRGGGGSRRH